MKALFKSLTSLAVVLVVASGASAVVITFESYPGADGLLGTADDVPISAPNVFSSQPVQLTTQYQSLGIEFMPSSPLQDMNEILNDSSWTRFVGTTPNLLSTRRGVHEYGPIEAVFTISGIRSLKMALGVGVGSGIRSNLLEIFDEFDNLIDSVTADDAFVTLTSNVDIRRFRVTATVSTWQAVIDDVEFVPEPATVTLLGLGLVGLLTRGKHRNERSR